MRVQNPNICILMLFLPKPAVFYILFFVVNTFPGNKHAQKATDLARDLNKLES